MALRKLALKTAKPSVIQKLRQSLGLTQTEMGERMGLTLRTYQDLEADPSKVRRRHQILAMYVSLEHAVETRQPMLASPKIRRLALDLVQDIRGERPTTPAAVEEEEEDEE